MYDINNANRRSSRRPTNRRPSNQESSLQDELDKFRARAARRTSLTLHSKGPSSASVSLCSVNRSKHSASTGSLKDKNNDSCLTKKGTEGMAATFHSSEVLTVEHGSTTKAHQSSSAPMQDGSVGTRHRRRSGATIKIDSSNSEQQPMERSSRRHSERRRSISQRPRPRESSVSRRREPSVSRRREPSVSRRGELSISNRRRESSISRRREPSVSCRHEPSARTRGLERKDEIISGTSTRKGRDIVQKDSSRRRSVSRNMRRRNTPEPMSGSSHSKNSRRRSCDGEKEPMHTGSDKPPLDGSRKKDNVSKPEIGTRRRSSLDAVTALKKSTRSQSASARTRIKRKDSKESKLSNEESLKSDKTRDSKKRRESRKGKEGTRRGRRSSRTVKDVPSLTPLTPTGEAQLPPLGVQPVQPLKVQTSSDSFFANTSTRSNKSPVSVADCTNSWAPANQSINVVDDSRTAVTNHSNDHDAASIALSEITEPTIFRAMASLAQQVDEGNDDGLLLFKDIQRAPQAVLNRSRGQSLPASRRWEKDESIRHDRAPVMSHRLQRTNSDSARNDRSTHVLSHRLQRSNSDSARNDRSGGFRSHPLMDRNVAMQHPSRVSKSMTEIVNMEKVHETAATLDDTGEILVEAAKAVTEWMNLLLKVSTSSSHTSKDQSSTYTNSSTQKEDLVQPTRSIPTTTEDTLKNPIQTNSLVAPSSPKMQPRGASRAKMEEVNSVLNSLVQEFVPYSHGVAAPATRRPSIQEANVESAKCRKANRRRRTSVLDNLEGRSGGLKRNGSAPSLMAPMAPTHGIVDSCCSNNSKPMIQRNGSSPSLLTDRWSSE